MSWDGEAGPLLLHTGERAGRAAGHRRPVGRAGPKRGEDSLDGSIQLPPEVNALQPALSQAGAEGLWTPVLVPRIGYCEYYCSLCTQVCPTGALRELTVREKTKVSIGSAWIRKDRCSPYAFGRRCTVCEEQCPTSPKAIRLVETELMFPDGTWALQQVPVVDLEVCIGCGICERKCPVEDDPAIYCTSLGESRSMESASPLDPPGAG